MEFGSYFQPYYLMWRAVKKLLKQLLRDVKADWLIVTDDLPEKSVEAEQLRHVTLKFMHEITAQALHTMQAQCQKILELHLFEGLEKHEILQHVDVSKSAFYRHWEKCYKELQRLIRKKLEKEREKKSLRSSDGIDKKS